MIERLIEIGAHKKGSKRQLGIYLGFSEKDAGQRVNKILNNQNITMKIFKKLLSAAELDNSVELIITLEHKKLFDK